MDLVRRLQGITVTSSTAGLIRRLEDIAIKSRMMELISRLETLGSKEVHHGHATDKVNATRQEHPDE